VEQKLQWYNLLCIQQVHVKEIYDNPTINHVSIFFFPFKVKLQIVFMHCVCLPLVFMFQIPTSLECPIVLVIESTLGYKIIGFLV
jgi:hypothetical protein